MQIADKPGFYREASRVLKPVGQVALSNVAAGPNGPPLFPVPWATSPDASFLSSPTETRDDLEDAGFEILHFEDTSANRGGPQGIEGAARRRVRCKNRDRKLVPTGPEFPQLEAPDRRPGTPRYSIGGSWATRPDQPPTPLRSVTYSNPSKIRTRIVGTKAAIAAPARDIARANRSSSASPLGGGHSADHRVAHVIVGR